MFSKKGRVVLGGLLWIVILSCKTASQEKGQNKFEEKVLSEAEIQKIKAEINADQKTQQLQAFFEKKASGGYNGSVLIAQHDVILYQNTFGYATDTIPLNSGSKFQLASLSKTFTAVAIMQLVEQGKLGLEQTVKDFFPTFPYEGVTIRSLLCHRSGLPFYQYEMDRLVIKQNAFPTNQQMMVFFSTARPTPKMMNQPDHFFAYNNTNYAVLAAIVEKISNLSFADYLRKNIFEPLNMHSSYVLTSPDPASTANRTVGYQHGKKIPLDHYDYITGDKGVLSTADDLLKWYKALKSERLLKKETLQEMYMPRSFEHPGLRNYGYGFRLWVNDKQQTDYIYHTGWWKGYNTIMFFDLRTDFVIIVLSNKYNKSIYNVKEIVDILHEGKKNNTLEENILDQ